MAFNKTSVNHETTGKTKLFLVEAASLRSSSALITGTVDGDHASFMLPKDQYEELQSYLGKGAPIAIHDYTVIGGDVVKSVSGSKIQIIPVGAAQQLTVIEDALIGKVKWATNTEVVAYGESTARPVEELEILLDGVKKKTAGNTLLRGIDEEGNRLAAVLPAGTPSNVAVHFSLNGEEEKIQFAKLKKMLLANGHAKYEAMDFVSFNTENADLTANLNTDGTFFSVVRGHVVADFGSEKPSLFYASPSDQNDLVLDIGTLNSELINDEAKPDAPQASMIIEVLSTSNTQAQTEVDASSANEAPSMSATQVAEASPPVKEEEVALEEVITTAASKEVAASIESDGEDLDLNSFDPRRQSVYEPGIDKSVNMDAVMASMGEVDPDIEANITALLNAAQEGDNTAHNNVDKYVAYEERENGEGIGLNPAFAGEEDNQVFDESDFDLEDFDDAEIAADGDLLNIMSQPNDMAGEANDFAERQLGDIGVSF